MNAYLSKKWKNRGWNNTPSGGPTIKDIFLSYDPDFEIPRWVIDYQITFRRKINNHKAKGWIAISLYPYRLIYWGKTPIMAANILRQEYDRLKAKDVLLTKLITYRTNHGGISNGK